MTYAEDLLLRAVVPPEQGQVVDHGLRQEALLLELRCGAVSVGQFGRRVEPIPATSSRNTHITQTPVRASVRRVKSSQVNHLVDGGGPVPLRELGAVLPQDQRAVRVLRLWGGFENERGWLIIIITLMVLRDEPGGAHRALCLVPPMCATKRKTQPRREGRADKTSRPVGT